MRSTLIHGAYQPANRPSPSWSAAESIVPSAASTLAADVRARSLTWDEILDRYVRLVHENSKNLTETARKLGKHRSTVQKRLGLDE